MRVALISLEPWDDTWRRNQHLAAQLVAQGLVEHLLFVEPPVLGKGPSRKTPLPGITTLRPALVVPKRYGGLALAARTLPLRDVDVVWVNSPELGVHCTRRRPAVYDVTDDWRTFDQVPHVLARLLTAEDRLAKTARTVVCSQVLAHRWQERYGVSPTVVHNGVDADAFARAVPRDLGPGPHLGYVGTLHAERLDVALCASLAGLPGTLHLVGPDALDEASRARLLEAGAVLHGPVPAADVPGWMTAMDVLLSPHVVSPFTLSLDAIKSYEYLATGRPVVATPTSGFQLLTAPQLACVEPDRFAAAVSRALSDPPVAERSVAGWDGRARKFFSELAAAAG